MGILNITPDSFSDGGSYLSQDQAISRASRMVVEGACIIDVGGESTRPGADQVAEQEELDRVIPVIEALSREIDRPISIDTSKPAVMQAAVAAGAGMINDVFALQAPGALETVASLEVPVCLMHMQGEPRSMQVLPEYQDVVIEVREFLRERTNACLDAGIPRERVLIDPGFGFGKTLEHNLRLLKNLTQLRELKLPLLVGISRKSMIGTLLNGAPVDERVFGSIAAAVLAVIEGAAILRVHDVKATIDALKVVRAVQTI